MIAVFIVFCVVGGLTFYTAVGATIDNYIYNHVDRLTEDTDIGRFFGAVLWPIGIWFVLAYAWTVRPTDKARRDPFVWHLLTRRERNGKVPRGMRKELERRKAINDMERELGLEPTVWHSFE